ncbi:MAG: ABC transporter substrate-binding protein [Alphaproteobacteria bacterium GM202ARS2]|nr:ABC transporter substrate-binding protein [Alphaproteobacteria bacterium GM202ARS2]
MNHARLILAVVAICLSAPAYSQEESSGYGLALHGQPKYPEGFEHFDYANPNAPKGGRIRLATIGSFDSFNPFILKGVAASGLTAYVFETLMTNSADEPYTQYGLIAERAHIAPDNTSVTFTLRDDARFHDGSPITADDVVFSFQTIIDKGHPFYKSYFRDVKDVKALSERTVVFSFHTDTNKELPLIIGSGLQIMSRAWWDNHDFAKSLHVPPMGSGPYKVADFDSGKYVVYERNKDYWGKDLNVNKGRYNFDTLHIDYYRDATVARQAFKAGDYDFTREFQAKAWANDYDFPARQDGHVIVEEIPHQMVSGMQGFVFNTRRFLFRDRRVRIAMNYAYDFEWSNKALFHNAYTRTTSYFDNSELASRGPISKEEAQRLAPFKEQLPPEVFDAVYEPPSGGTRGIRSALRKAQRLLQEAGWVLRDNQLVHTESGQPFQFEMLVRNPAFERVVAPYKRNLEKLGIKVNIRTIQDDSQYQKRLDEFDYDMITVVYGASLSPGNEQADYWSSAAATTKGSRNYAGAQSPVIDALVSGVINAQSRLDLVHAVRALDRVLLSYHFVVPHFHIQVFRIAWWNRFSRPDVLPPYTFTLDFWWVDKEKDANLSAR